MFLCDKYDAARLPDIEVYGGDTTPWSIQLIKPDGGDFPYDSLTGCTAVLTFTPFAIGAGYNAMTSTITPVLQLEGTITGSPDGTATVLFNFSTADTFGLRGKYLYQVEISNGEDTRIGQGCVIIKQNINRS